MKKISTLLLALWVAATAWASTPQEAWETTYPQIQQRIKAPQFRDKDYKLFDYGKKSKTKGYLYTELINKTIDLCSREGGGRVIIPKGTWLTGPITLKDNVNLYLEEGATLLFTTDPKEYPIVRTRWEGMDCYNYQPLVYAIDATNIALSGKGVLDGQASNANWWGMSSKKGHDYDGPEPAPATQKVGRPLLQEWNENGVPVEKRILGDGYGMRPQMVNFVNCKNVLIQDVTLLRSPFWVIHPLFCENLTVKGVIIQNDGPNGDGCDPESCKDVLIEDCSFDTGDDCIAIKSGRNRDGIRDARPTENVIVRNCRMKNGHGGIVVGSEISGGFKNLFAENCVMDSPDLDRVVRIKTNSCRSGVIENIYVRNIEVGQCKEAVLKINLLYERREACDHSYPPVVQNVYLQNITCQKSEYGVKIESFEDLCNVRNIEVIDCHFNNVSSGGNSIEGLVKNLIIANTYINGKLVDEYSPLSQRMVLSEMKRNPKSTQLDHQKGPKWTYAVGTELDAFINVANRYGDKAIEEYALSYVDSLVNPDGTIKTYKISDYNLDQCKNGTLLMVAYDRTGDERYKKAMDTLHEQLKGQPKTADGGYWHKKVYPHQMWLDGLFMAEPFSAKYAKRFLSPEEQAKEWDNIANQFLTVAKHTYDPATGLYRHAWDESKEQFWCDKETGQSAHAWARAQGWIFMALLDVLEEMPADNPNRPELVKLLKSLADGVVKFQDTKSGCWFQVLDQPGREGNYLEGTATAMYVYSLLRGVRMGLLDDSYLQAALTGWNGMQKNLIRQDKDGTISLLNCCAVGGLGGKNMRDGSFEYYLSEPIIENDCKGVGPYINAALEMERR
ncbi:MAG: glycoside hydrolase family 88 protein [Muribaculaceae bacterium]|nr:glycoside hydrolase family 88 protein [Muribaculaceae bacterium]